MRPVLFHLPDWLPAIGGAAIPSYGVFTALGCIAACLIFGLLVRAHGKDGGRAFEILLETMLVAILSSKLIGLLFQDMSADISLWQRFVMTGGVWYVGFLSGVAYLTIRSRSIGLSTLSVLDYGACAVPVGHALGRVGCFLAGCCYGSPCNLPWGVTFTSEAAHARAGTPLGVPLHPVQLYEIGTELVIFTFLVWWLFKKARFEGQTGFLYLVLHAVARFFNEFLRDDHRGGLGPLSTSQAIALAIIAISVPVLVIGARRGSLLPGGGRRG